MNVPISQDEAEFIVRLLERNRKDKLDVVGEKDEAMIEHWNQTINSIKISMEVALEQDKWSGNI